MRLSLFGVAALVACASLAISAHGKLVTPDPLASVNTLIGAGGVGFQAGGIAPGPQVPFGAMRLSPDTSLDRIWLQFQHFGGYSYMDTHIRCFSHTHLVGAGVGDFGNFGMQAYGQPASAAKLSEAAWYRSPFSHSTEQATPGLYAVTLDGPQVGVRLTAAGTLSGVHEYTFLPRSPEAPTAAIVLDVCASVSGEKHACPLAEVEVTPATQDSPLLIQAHVRTAGALTARSDKGGVDVYLAAAFVTEAGQPQPELGLWVDGQMTGDLAANSTAGSLGAFVDFGPGVAGEQRSVLVYVGLSFINASMAQLNLQTQLAAVDPQSQWPAFDTVLQATQQLWRETLSVVEIQVEDGLEDANDDRAEATDLDQPFATPLFGMTTFALNDTTCRGTATGGIEFHSETCALTPDSVNPMYKSMQLYNVDPASGNYSLNLYNESPACDDFVGFFLNGTLGNTPANCETTNYFAFQIVQINQAEGKAQRGSGKKQLLREAALSKRPARRTARAPSPVSAEQFYSLLYHSFLSPTAYTETNGLYLGFDGLVHAWSYAPANGAPTTDYYSDMSLWDVHRTQLPLIGLLRPDVATDIVRSLYSMFLSGGDVPRWPLANVYTGCMSGNHGLVAVAEWVAKGVVDTKQLQIDPADLLAAALDMVDTPRVHGGRDDLANYTQAGFVPLESDSKGAAMTLEYAFDDWAVAVLAETLGDTANAARLLQRSQNYRNVWSSDRQLMCPRSIDPSVGLQCPSSLAALLPYPAETGYVEADAWQELWFVPHDPAGLVALFPSPQAFVDKLQTFVQAGFEWIFPHEEIPNDFYWSGNEPDILAPWMFAWADRPDLTQNFTRQILKGRYQPTPQIGLPGNDDYGTLSAWATWASLGLYPQAGNTTYVLGSPVFPQVTIHRTAAQGGDLVITAAGTSDENRFVSTVSVNGVDLNSPFLTHDRLNGQIAFTMTDAPSLALRSSEVTEQ